jgi:hypothetical protein
MFKVGALGSWPVFGGVALALACSAAPGEVATFDRGDGEALSAAQAGVDLDAERGGIGVDLAGKGLNGPISTRGFTLETSSLTPEEYDRTVLAVTDTEVSQIFTLSDVMDQLAAQASARGSVSTGLDLFQQIWDTQRTAQSGLGGPAHCDDFGAPDESGNSTFNGFRFQCPRIEGDQATQQPFTDIEDSYVAVGLTNRFDLAPADGSTCGEYRLVFARRSGMTDAFERAFMIFEAELPNPSASKLGLQGCRPVMEFWNDLAAETDSSLRLERLRSFYFNGLAATTTTPAFNPVIHIDNYGATSAVPTGQIRTNSFMETPWTLREFKLEVDCGASCSLVAAPVTVKTNPSATLFKPNATDATQPPTDPAALAFQRDFIPTAVAGLAAEDVNAFNYSVPEQFNTGESLSQLTDDDYVRAAGTNQNSFLRTQIRSALPAGSTLTADQILERTMALSCSGCHQRSNDNDIGPSGQTFPASAGFVHIAENTTEPDPDGGERFGVSPALSEVFLPHRRAVLSSQLRWGIKRTTTAPIINGTIDAVWKTADKMPLRHVVSGTVSSEADGTAALKALFDGTNLYLLLEVLDNKKVRDSSSNSDDDSVEIFIDANNEKLSSYGPSDAVYRVTWNVSTLEELKRSATSGVTFSRVDTSTGYRIEMKLPWSTLGQANVGAGGLLGIDVQVNDDDLSGARDGKSGWWANDEGVLTNPSLMGTAELRD